MAKREDRLYVQCTNRIAPYICSGDSNGFSAAINDTPGPRDTTVVDYFSWLLKCSQSKPEKTDNQMTLL